jgi:hypothetical protein
MVRSYFRVDIVRLYNPLLINMPHVLSDMDFHWLISKMAVTRLAY